MPNPNDRYGGYYYDSHTVRLTNYPDSRDAKPRMAERVGEDGSFTQGGLTAAGRLLVQGVLGGPGLGTVDIEDAWIAFRAAHAPGTPVPLFLEWFGENRYRWAECLSVREVTGSRLRWRA